MIKSRHTISRAIPLLVTLIASGLLNAETITLQALDDFPSTDEGEVPYYREDDRGTLAINAANEEFRDKFARATGNYNGTGGTYDLTLNTVGEEDGDCEYRILVNGAVVGTIINDPTTESFADQQHTLPDIIIPAGATLSVESNALSNGLIPENGGFAFARGRWQSLILQNDSPATTPVDLALATSVVGSGLEVGENFTLRIEVENTSATDTATQPLVSVIIPASVDLTPPAECTVEGSNFTCALSELGAQQTQSIDLNGSANTTGQFVLEASVTANQSDNNQNNNTSSVTVDVLTAETPATVDLQLAVVASTGLEALVVGDTVSYTMQIRNTHSSNVATAPIAGVILPANLQFQQSADCSLDGINLLCNLSELAPDALSTVVFTAIAISAGDSTFIASVSATESEDLASDNEVVFPVTVIATSPASPPTESAAGGNGGGGGISFLILLPLLARQSRRIRHF